MDNDLAKDISAKFRHAFGADLTPFRAGGSNFPLYVGDKPELADGKDELSREFVSDLQDSNVRLDEQGDGMRSFASVLLNIFAARTHSIQFLDEPEAFLHPPQARLLGKYIAENRIDSSQLFISTHSTDILDGLIEGGSKNVRIVRICRKGDINFITELSKSETESISKDTLSRFSRVFEGIFFEHVIICESDADCMFYQSIIELKEVSGERRADVLFVHTSGKHRMAKLAKTLRSLDVPVSVIADIDLLNDKDVFRNLLSMLGGDWQTVEGHWKAVSDAVIAQRPPLNAEQILTMIQTELEGVSGAGKFPVEKEKAIKDIFRSVSPWSALKRSGRSALPAGGVITHFDRLWEACGAKGLWMVPVGEIEGFCRSVGSHGPGFVEKVLEERDIANDPELNEARQFMTKIWLRASS